MAKLTSLVPQSRGGQVEPFHERRVSCAGSRPVPDPVPGVARRLVALSSVFVQRWLRARRSRRRLTCRSRQVAYDVDDPEQELQRLRFRGVSLLFGVPAFQRLQNARVAVLGIGGVGSWVVESLARSGIGALTLVDLDEICISNTNRQLHTLMDTVGRPKVDVMAERVRLINPECKVDTVQDFFVQETESQILDRQLDVVVDAIDGVANKCRLIYACRERHIPVVVSGGLGGKADPTQFCEDDITRVHGDGLTRRVRNTLPDWMPKENGFGNNMAFLLVNQREGGESLLSTAPRHQSLSRMSRWTKERSCKGRPVTVAMGPFAHLLECRDLLWRRVLRRY
ncbi:unnamed protein product [Durusdinium trenchii]|uniref:THIF-type NAD/FAD binding fold domain-containing protein n=2 Tax=Durusdinium trenchii TaxID=1381693 RepID=A0ABP0STM1_9DINO